MDFVQSEHEHAMYKRSHGDDILLVGVYVDDLVITGSSLAVVEEFKEEMKRAFLMSDLGLLSFYLGALCQEDPGDGEHGGLQGCSNADGGEAQVES
jgi:hypothetical protein